MDGLTDLVDPDRVHAIVIGLEDFEGARLDGPVADALAFVAWLRSLAVPAKNITLWLYPQEQNSDSARTAVQAHGVRPEWVTRQDASRLVEELRRRREGDLLYIYWAGHGVTAGQGRRLLMLPCDVDRNPLWLSADELYELLSDEEVCAFPRQVYLIDACAVYAENRSLPLNPPELPLGAYRRRSLPQFVIYATATDQVALGPDGRGAFSRTVTDWLEHQTCLLPDLDSLARVLDEQFPPGSYRQTPVLRVQNWRGHTTQRTLDYAVASVDSAVLESIRQGLLTLAPTPPADALERLTSALRLRRPARLDPADELATLLLIHSRALATLVELTDQGDQDSIRRLLRMHAVLGLHKQSVHMLSVNEHRRICDIVRTLTALTAQDVEHCQPPGTEAGPVLAMDESSPQDLLVQQLDRFDRTCLKFSNIQDAPFLPPVIRFLENLAALPACEPRATDIRDLTRSITDRLAISPEVLLHVREEAVANTARLARTPLPVRVIARLESYDKDQYLCSVWTDRGNGAPTLVSSGSDLPCDQHEVVRRVIAANRSLGQVGAGSNQLVEIVLDDADLQLDVANWDGPANELSPILGWEYPVAIRSLNARSDADIRRRWEAPQTAPVLLHDADASDPGFYKRLSRESDASRVIVLAGPNGRVLAVQLAIRLGYPIIIWDAEAAVEVDERHFDPLDPGGDPEGLPERVRHRRKSAGPPGPRRPVLVWQHPDRPLGETLQTARHT
ncbi:hypothetical protein ADK60_37840 [Streptomyces sp. XY431]|uniref:VMAP-C domain-containing protein n=1 Tax=Streptomyces sp. XY431 TaxID=1415562 RepID=UPI0006AFD65C|nr:caspase family protein [Streptomyces sp. XY431]KOV10491.1 hypothetical protein ADK60_37840 [Streptomyces sp. XY431]